MARVFRSIVWFYSLVMINWKIIRGNLRKPYHSLVWSEYQNQQPTLSDSARVFRSCIFYCLLLLSCSPPDSYQTIKKSDWASRPPRLSTMWSMWQIDVDPLQKGRKYQIRGEGRKPYHPLVWSILHKEAHSSWKCCPLCRFGMSCSLKSRSVNSFSLALFVALIAW